MTGMDKLIDDLRRNNKIERLPKEVFDFVRFNRICADGVNQQVGIHKNLIFHWLRRD